jgi:hypothetical protein
MSRAYALRRLYAQYGGTMSDSYDEIARELARESAERRGIVAAVLDGVSLADIGRRMGGVTGGAISSRLELTMRAIRKRIELGAQTGGYVLGANENRLPDDLRAEARRLAAEGVPRKEICAKLTISQASLSRWFKADARSAGQP